MPEQDYFPEVIRRKVEDLIPYANNTKQHPEDQVAEIMASMQEFKFITPIEIADDVIVAGHGRLVAAKRLGLTEVPCIDVSHLSEGQRKAYRIASNRLAEKAPWDNPLLAIELEAISSLPDMNPKLTGFDADEIATLILANADDIPEGDEDRSGLGTPVVSYEIIFDDTGQQSAWFNFIRYLKREIDGETLGERLEQFLDQNSYG